MNDLEELKRLAQAATPGPWMAFSRTRFHAAAQPAAVLALIERVERAEKERDLAKIRLERDGGRLADEVAVLVRKRVVDQRSPVADALLDFCEPPASERADRLVALERDNVALRARLQALLDDPRMCGDAATAARAALEAKEKRSESVLAQGEDTVRVYEFWKQNPDGSTAYRLECAECGTVFRKSRDEDEE